jgi:NitT/TauT family transport system substrate-binding protein
MREAHSAVAIATRLLVIAGCLSSGCRKTEPDEGPPGGQGAKAIQAEPGSARTQRIPDKPLTIAYSDWPGWVAWEIAIQKGWFEEAGVNVEFKWFEYVPSMEAFSANRVDAVSMTNGDALVTGSSGTASKAIVLNDYSNGNDMVVARAGIESIAALKGKKVAVEVGFVDHLLLMSALKSAGLTEADIQIVNVPTDQTPQALKSGQVDAIAAWQPNSGQALREVAGSKAIFTSADVPGLIYDQLAVNPTSLAQNREAWKRVVKTWLRVADFIADETNRPEILRIMSARVGLTPDRYADLMKGTHFLGLDGNLRHFAPGGDLSSVYFSSKTVDSFNVANNVYKASIAVDPYFDATLVAEIAAERAGK